jgi:Resolvase, N terminal domain
MAGQRVGYIRVSSFDQNPERQLESIALDRVFTDKASGKDARRPQLELLMGFVRSGDIPSQKTGGDGTPPPQTVSAFAPAVTAKRSATSTPNMAVNQG